MVTGPISGIMRAIAALIPGEQSFLGELSSTGPLAGIPGVGGIAELLGALIPGQQTFLGEGSAVAPYGMDLANLKTKVVKSWNTGTAQFIMTADGLIHVRRKNGTIKSFRPRRHIVVSSNPRLGTFLRAEKRIDKMGKRLRKKAGKR